VKCISPIEKLILNNFPDSFLQIYIIHINTMALISEGAKDRITTVVDMAKTVFHWGFMPTVIYLGFQKGTEPGMPELSLASLLWA
jgi:import receptor subunit TOM7